MPGQTAAFSVTATGTAPLNYQWQFNSANISGANGATYSIAGAKTNNAGNYRVIVSNSAGSVTSSVAPSDSDCAQFRPPSQHNRCPRQLSRAAMLPSRGSDGDCAIDLSMEVQQKEHHRGHQQHLCVKQRAKGQCRELHRHRVKQRGIRDQQHRGPSCSIIP